MILYEEYCQQLSADLLYKLDPFHQFNLELVETSSNSTIRFNFFVDPKKIAQLDQELKVHNTKVQIEFKCLITYNVSYNEPQFHFQIYKVSSSVGPTDVALTGKEDNSFATFPQMDEEAHETEKFINVDEFHAFVSSLGSGPNMNYFFHVYEFPIMLDNPSQTAGLLSSGEIFYSVQNCDTNEIISSDPKNESTTLLHKDYMKKWCSVYVLPILRDLCFESKQ